MYLVVGASGYLGAYVLKNILKDTNEIILATARDLNNISKKNNRIIWTKCDISCRDEVNALIDLSKKYNQELKVIYLAAYHHPDKVAINFKYAWDINITSLSYFINCLENVKCFFYPSTDSVYGESFNQHLFDEEDILYPVNMYGRQKVVAEFLVNSYGYNVVRFPFLIGPSLLPYKKHFFDEIVEKIYFGERVEMFLDSYRSALDFDTAAKLLIKLIEVYTTDMPSIINLSGDEILSKYDIGLKIAEKYNIDKSLIVPISIDNTKGIFKERRAKSTLMNNNLLKQTLNIGRGGVKMKF